MSTSKRVHGIGRSSTGFYKEPTAVPGAKALYYEFHRGFQPRSLEELQRSEVQGTLTKLPNLRFRAELRKVPLWGKRRLNTGA